MKEGALVFVSLNYATYGLVINNEIVVEAAPIARWMLGKPWIEVATWLARKGARTMVQDAKEKNTWHYLSSEGIIKT